MGHYLNGGQHSVTSSTQKTKLRIHPHISWTYGPSAWEEVLAIEGEMRRIRKEEAYKKQEFIDTAINGVIGTVIFLIAALGVGTALYYFGKHQDKW